MLDLFFESAWKVVVAGLLLGAGLPVLFAVGVRSSVLAAAGPGTPGLEGAAPAALPASVYRVVSVLCFAVVLLAVALGISIIIAAGLGKEVSFENVFPTFVPKD